MSKVSLSKASHVAASSVSAGGGEAFPERDAGVFMDQIRQCGHDVEDFASEFGGADFSAGRYDLDAGKVLKRLRALGHNAGQHFQHHGNLERGEKG